jgi:hypothetical protein
LGEAVLSGSLTCVRLLLEGTDEDESEPSVLELAAGWGYWDVVRALRVKWPEGDAGEAFAFAACLGQEEGAAGLRGMTFKWSERVVKLVTGLPVEVLGRVAKWFGRTWGEAGRV